MIDAVIDTILSTIDTTFCSWYDKILKIWYHWECCQEWLGSFLLPQDAEGLSMYKEDQMKGQKTQEMTRATLQKDLEGKLAPKLTHLDFSKIAG